MQRFVKMRTIRLAVWVAQSDATARRLIRETEEGQLYIQRRQAIGRLLERLDDLGAVVPSEAVGFLLSRLIRPSARKSG